MFYSTGSRVGALKLSVIDIKLFYLLPDVVAKLAVACFYKTFYVKSFIVQAPKDFLTKCLFPNLIKSEIEILCFKIKHFFWRKDILSTCSFIN